MVLKPHSEYFKYFGSKTPAGGTATAAMMPEFLMALGLVLVIEGLLFDALVPGHLKAMMLSFQKLSDDQLRVGGVSAMALGVVIVWLVRSVAS